MRSRKIGAGFYCALALAVLAVAVAVSAFLPIGSQAANAAGWANTGRAESPNGVYHVQDPANKLRVYTSDFQVAEDWAFCINNGRSYPGFYLPGDPNNPNGNQPYFDGKYYYVGNELKNVEDMLSTFLASRPLNKEQTAKAIQELLFVFHEDPEGWREQLGALFPSTPQGDQLWYWQIQQAIWHFSDNATMPNLLPASYVQRIERIAKGEEPSMIPASKKVEVRSYDAAGGWWRFGKQNVVTARVTNNVQHYLRVIKLDGNTYGTKSDAELVSVLEGNTEGLAGAKMGMYYEEGVVTFTDKDNPSAPPFEVKWDTQKYAWLFQFWEGDHAYRVVEESAPNGYSSADPVDYTFDSNGRVKLTGTVDSANARLISKDAINWNNYKWDDKLQEIPADVIVVFDYKSQNNTHPISIEKTGSVMKDGAFSTQAIAGAKFRLQKTPAGVNEPIEWTSEAFVSKQLDLAPGEYELTELEAPAGYVKNTGSFAFQVGSDGSITPINGVFGDAVTVTGNKISLNNASEKSVKTTASWKDAGGKRLFYDGSEFDAAPASMAVSDRIEYRGFEPGWYVAFATFVKNNEGEQIYSDGYVQFEVPDGKPDGTADVVVNIDKSRIDVNAQTSFTVIEKIYREDQVKTDGDGKPVRPDASVSPYAEHADVQSFDQTVMIDVTKPQGEVVFNKHDAKGASLEGAVLSVQIKRGSDWVNLHEWTAPGKDDTVRLQLPEGSYRLVEVGAPLGYAAPANGTFFEFTVDASGVKIPEGSGWAVSTANSVTTVNVSNAPIDFKGELKTTVKANGLTSSASASAKTVLDEQGKVSVSDTIEYSGLAPERTYVVSAELYEVADGKTVGAAKAAKTETLATGKAGADGFASGTWEIGFGDVSGLEAGKSYVVYESATSIDNLIVPSTGGKPTSPHTVSHQNPNDISQTFVVSVSSKSVTFSKVDLGGKEIAGANIEIKKGADTVATWVSVAGESKKVDLGPGSYTFHEVAAPSGYKVATDFEFTVGDDGSVTLSGVQTSGDVVVEGDRITVLDRTHPGSDSGDPSAPHLATTVEAGGSTAQADAPTKVSAAQAMPGVGVVDKIAYKNLVGGKTYAVTGRLFEVVDGNVAADAKPIVTKTVEMQADASGAGTWDVDFGKVTGLKPGSSYVVFEKAVSIELLVDVDGDKVVDAPQLATHEDPTDPSQTVTVQTPDASAPALATTVSAAGSTASAQAPASVSAQDAAAGVVVVDTVSYKNLVPGKAYRLSGSLVEVKGGQVVGNIVDMTVVRTASDTGTGAWTLDFGAVEKLEPGKTYVVFEEAVSVDDLVDEDGNGTADKPQVATHDDPTDTAQTVTVAPDPNTPGGEDPFVPGNGDTPSLKTTVTAGKATSSSAAAATVPASSVAAGVAVSDTVEYSNLHGGKAYKVTAKLMHITGGALLENPVLSTTVTKVADSSGSGTWTIDLGETTDLHEGDSYVVFEYAVSLEKLVDGNGDGVADAPQTARHDDPTDNSQTFVVNPDPGTPGGEDPFAPGGGDKPSLKTTASANGVAASAGSPAVVAAADAGAGVAVSDTVAYSNLFGGKEYKVTATLKRIEGGRPVEDVATVTVQKVAAVTGSGTWTIDLGTAALKPGATYVVYEQAVSVENLVDANGDKQPDAPQSASHEDPSDKAQAVTVSDPNNPGGEEPFVPGNGDTPSLKTTVKAGSSTASAAAAAKLTASEAAKGASVVDTIDYTNLYGGKQYEVTARLMPVKDGAVSGEPLVTVTVRRTADLSGSGSWTVPLGTVEGLEEDMSYVVFEKAVSIDNLVDRDGDGNPDELQTGSHEDPRDNSQTVTVAPDPKEDPKIPDPPEPDKPVTPDPSKPGEPVDPGENGPKRYVTVMPSTGDTAWGFLALLGAGAAAAGGMLALRRRRG